MNGFRNGDLPLILRQAQDERETKARVRPARTNACLSAAHSVLYRLPYGLEQHVHIKRLVQETIP